MLTSLRVKNVALINESDVEFAPGLNILTGETGAGKSIIIGSISLALGAKADRDMIRQGAEYGFVELVFCLDTAQQETKLREMDIYTEEDRQLVLQRRILPNKSIYKINGETVTAKTVRDIAEILIDIHGQHEHQSLLHKRKHFEILNDFCRESLQDLLSVLKVEYSDYMELTREREAAGNIDTRRDKEIALARFELEEIVSVHLHEGEDEELEKQYRRMANGKRIAETGTVAHQMLAGEIGENASSLVGRALRGLHGMCEYDTGLEEICGELEHIEEQLIESGRNLSRYLEKLEFDEQEFNEVSERLNLVNHLKAKYGNTISCVLEYMEEKEAYIRKMDDFEGYLQALDSKIEKKRAEILDLCHKTSEIRVESAGILSKKMQEALQDLNFLNVDFQIDVRPDPDQFGPDGFDDVEFMISLNVGEERKPLGSVASGGELSRIMLALKTVLADKDQIETLIFDEIDAGISGKTAWKVSEKLGLLGEKHQVLCITHLPQIAAMADAHFVIEKTSDTERTSTCIRRADSENSVLEVARLLGSDILTESVIQNAKELKELASRQKNKKNSSFL